jgi:hypothetical protein
MNLTLDKEYRLKDYHNFTANILINYMLQLESHIEILSK